MLRHVEVYDQGVDKRFLVVCENVRLASVLNLAIYRPG